MRLTRRQSIAGVIALTAAANVPGWANPVVESADDLKPGQFTWHPDRSPAGPVSIIVSIPDQRVHVYRNGIRIAVSTCSTGKVGHATPTGVFTVLQKDKNHHSSTYNNAPMPNMNRLTWSGIALHAGQLPGFPASHGCVRLPLEFSARLFEITHVGTAVIIAGAATDPREVAHPGLLLSPVAEDRFETAVAGLRTKSLPGRDHESNPTPAASVLVSAADSQIVVLENGEIVAQGAATIRDPGQPLGSHVFILNGAHDTLKGLAWRAIGHAASGSAQEPPAEVLSRVSGPPDVLDAITSRLHPGLVFVTTDLPAHPDTRSGKDLVVISQDDA